MSAADRLLQAELAPQRRLLGQQPVGDLVVHERLDEHLRQARQRLAHAQDHLDVVALQQADELAVLLQVLHRLGIDDQDDVLVVQRQVGQHLVDQAQVRRQVHVDAEELADQRLPDLVELARLADADERVIAQLLADAALHEPAGERPHQPLVRPDVVAPDLARLLDVVLDLLLHDHRAQLRVEVGRVHDADDAAARAGAVPAP